VLIPRVIRSDGFMEPTLVLGAGASADYGMPTGKELVSEVIQCCSDQHLLFPKLLECGCSRSELVELGRRLRDSEPDSIDFFLAANPDLRNVGKRAIAAVLLKSENADSVRGSWYKMLFCQMLRDISLSSARVVHIVTFNYDRSLELYFYRAALAHFAHRDRAQPFLAHIIPWVRHLHGRLVELPEENAHGVAYGEACQAELIARSAERIHFAYEQTEDAYAFSVARGLLADADEIVFLGFAFHDDILRNLNAEQWKDCRMIVSGYGFRPRLRDRIKEMFPSAEIGQSEKYLSDETYLSKFLENRKLC